MRKLFVLLVLACLLPCPRALAGIYGRVHGVVHDPQHRPVAGAKVVLKAAHSNYSVIVNTAQDGSFQLSSIPLGDYSVEVSDAGFATQTRTVTMSSDAS